ncbi:hypothetical protein [Rubellimicrobium sp. CFH 75288]|uniref:hypothetical protein n=1 Tax=Rubellimicrobium sp. CFH 75288 TaxID=2697034 RepID=UPI0014121DEC|nr:hypothetical protein [Rubellimicrobium sp. CFH 75288]NAZ37287.1 hypothetical protein [Rubellimicrobium sp. CFH 75288]
MRDLGRLAALLEARDRSRLAALKAREDERQAQLQALEAARADRARTATAKDAARRVGADLRWERWLAGRTEALRREILALRIEAEAARAALARSWGRRDAAEFLARQEARARQAARLRRLEREG